MWIYVDTWGYMGIYIYEIYMRYIYVYVCKMYMYIYIYTCTRAHDAVRFKMELAKSLKLLKLLRGVFIIRELRNGIV